jgi:hypothetical protein
MISSLHGRSSLFVPRSTYTNLLEYGSCYNLLFFKSTIYERKLPRL